MMCIFGGSVFFVPDFRPAKIVEPEEAAIELEQEFHAHEDMSHFFIRPMKKGEVLRTRGVSWFLAFREGKVYSSKEYRLLYRCDPRLFMTEVR